MFGGQKKKKLFQSTTPFARHTKGPSGLHPKVSLTKPIIPIVLMFKPWKVQNVRINPGHDAKHRNTSRSATDKNGMCGTCRRSDQRKKKLRNPEKRGGSRRGALREYVANCAPNLRKVAGVLLHTREEGCANLSQI